MNIKLIQLFKKLSVSDSFAEAFENKKSVDKKHEVAKSNFTEFGEKISIDCFNYLKNVSNIKQRFSKKYILNVRKGARKLNLSLATLTLLCGILAATASVNVASATPTDFYAVMQSELESECVPIPNEIKTIIGHLKYCEKFSFKKCFQTYKNEEEIIDQVKKDLGLNPKKDEFPYSFIKIVIKNKYFGGNETKFNIYKRSLQIFNQINFYKKIVNKVECELRTRLKKDIDDIEAKGFIVSGEEGDCNTIEIKAKRDCDKRKVNYKIHLGFLKHIIFGKFDKNFATLRSGGHTKNALKILDKIKKQKISSVFENPFRNDFVKEILKNNEENKTYNIKCTMANGVQDCEIFDLNANDKYKTIFPKYWSTEDIIKAIQKCIEFGTILPSCSDRILYLAGVNNVYILTCVSRDNRILSVYPLRYMPTGNGKQKVPVNTGAGKIKVAEKDIPMKMMTLACGSQPDFNATKSEDTLPTDDQYVNYVSIDDAGQDKPIEGFETESKDSIISNDSESSEFNKNINEEIKVEQSTEKESKKDDLKSKIPHLVKQLSVWRNGKK